ncbi:hypothetical protein PP7435_CHR4-0295 [Komagataella phaffii CBS 7435]|uniref:Uncharacterized protein n=2 Tax=Komagataella phaffii TaxID=460519 RepID=C4R8K6_KOMPG|nr:Hypothetical protein PAS_chr4_0672 [Komagataella phaffii GS115]KAI0463360.1 hypothetical protein LJB42_003385 [Komagataella kurtzmanii]CAH2450667.1 Hypothetical protein BQ9382_C4-1550 [Komagataella phaffii CBS 7435]CAY71931.1 Hypothetical protein PAS_chr4_0672 [Komagataella phaffii GS115]CCA40468.1 hypothetical protein PP7435_CHR4-0295 [Komagataella phaffii CBS 7435]
MRPTQINFAAAKKTSFIRNIPVELTPLFIATGVACCSAVYFTTKKLRTDRTLRLGRKNPEFNEKFEEAVSKNE